MKILTLTLCVATLLAGQIPTAQAALMVDRTRLIFNESEKSISINVTNRNTRDPYLAQGWMEDSKGQKISGPLMVLPPVQRIEPDSKTVMRLQGLPDIAKLPKDKESVFYFNLREIPPKNEKPNVLTLAMQTRLKVFYRPEALRVDYAEDVLPGTTTLTLTRQGDSYVVNNPTPYHYTFVEARASVKAPGIESFEPIMVEPASSMPLNVAGLGNAPVLMFINDYGSQRLLPFNCTGSTCKAGKVVVPDRSAETGTREAEKLGSAS